MQNDENDKNDKKREETHHKIYVGSGLAMLEKSDIFIALWNSAEQENDASAFAIIQEQSNNIKKCIG